MAKLLHFVLVGGVILGCGDGSPATPGATRADSSGIELVSNSAFDRPLAWEFERVFRLGGGDMGPESFFQVPPHGLAFDPQGRIYVLDSGNRRIQIFSGSGEHIRTVGRRGDGPGEFQVASSFGVDSSGILTLHDFARRALMRFDTAGVYLDQQLAPPGIFGPLRVSGGARFFATRSTIQETGGLIFRLYRATVGDTVELARIPLPTARSIQYESCGIMISLSPVFDDAPAWHSGEGRLVLRAGPEYSVRIFENGVEVRHVRRMLEPEAATLEHAARQIGQGERWLIGDVPCTVPLEEVVEKRGIAERVPLIARVAVAPDGWLWVQRRGIGEAGPVDVFDPTGEYIGTLPPDTPWPAAFGPEDRILVLEADELEVQHVGVYRLQRD